MSGAASGEILVLTGPPGSGKTTAARALTAEAGQPAVHLQADGFWDAIGWGRIAPWLAEAHAQNAIVIKAVAAAARTYAEGGFLVIVDGIVGPWFLDTFRGLGVRVRYVVLRPDVEQAIARVVARDAAPLNPQDVRPLHRQFSDLGELEGHVVEVGGRCVEETLDDVRRALVESRFELR